MKTIRLTAGSLMVLTGILHLLPMFTDPKNPDALPMLIFAVAYLLTGVLLILDKRSGQFLGVIFPFIGLVIGFTKIGVRNWDTMLTIMFLIDAVVIICCLYLISRLRKS